MSLFPRTHGYNTSSALIKCGRQERSTEKPGGPRPCFQAAPKTPHTTPTAIFTLGTQARPGTARTDISAICTVPAAVTAHHREETSPCSPAPWCLAGWGCPGGLLSWSEDPGLRLLTIVLGTTVHPAWMAPLPPASHPGKPPRPLLPVAEASASFPGQGLGACDRLFPPRELDGRMLDQRPRARFCTLSPAPPSTRGGQTTADRPPREDRKGSQLRPRGQPAGLRQDQQPRVTSSVPAASPASQRSPAGRIARGKGGFSYQRKNFHCETTNPHPDPMGHSPLVIQKAAPGSHQSPGTGGAELENPAFTTAN